MNQSVQNIPLINLAIAMIPVIIVIGIHIKWALEAKEAIYSILRMLAQLLLIGYLLGFIFQAEQISVLLAVLAIMLFSSSWIALRTVKHNRIQLYRSASISIALGGGLSLILILTGVLSLQPWYEPRYMIPLAGMIFANSMTSISLAAERFQTELDRGASYVEARNIAFQAALIPIINSMFAVGLVTLPGMMTGQILSGVSPLIAARYQIMIMFVIFGSAGISVACFLSISRNVFIKEKKL